MFRSGQRYELPSNARFHVLSDVFLNTFVPLNAYFAHA